MMCVVDIVVCRIFNLTPHRGSRVTFDVSKFRRVDMSLATDRDVIDIRLPRFEIERLESVFRYSATVRCVSMFRHFDVSTFLGFDILTLRCVSSVFRCSTNSSSRRLANLAVGPRSFSLHIYIYSTFQTVSL